MADMPVVAVVTARPGSEKLVGEALGAAGEHLAQAPAIHPLSPHSAS